MRCAIICSGIVFAASAAAALADARRDPTQPPAAYGIPAAPSRNPIEAFRPQHIVTTGGERFVLWQGRRYRVGDTVQGARIDRIGESEVWVRSDGNLRRLPLYAGIEKKETKP